MKLMDCACLRCHKAHADDPNVCGLYFLNGAIRLLGLVEVRRRVSENA